MQLRLKICEIGRDRSPLAFPEPGTRPRKIASACCRVPVLVDCDETLSACMRVIFRVRGALPTVKRPPFRAGVKAVWNRCPAVSLVNESFTPGTVRR